MLQTSFNKYDFPLLGYIKMPNIEISNEDKERIGLGATANNEEYLKQLCRYGYKEKLNKGLIEKDKAKIYLDRIRLELDAVIGLGFTNYFLLINKLVEFSRNSNHINSPSRGSCGGCILFWLIGVISPHMNPIRLNLLFERFISVTRAKQKVFNGELYVWADSLPDVDLDSQHKFKPILASKINELFDSKNSAIGTFTTYSSKVLIKDVLKANEDLEEQDTKLVADLLEKKFGIVEEIAEALETNEPFKKWASEHIDSAQIAQSLNGLIRNRGVHPSGILLCNESLSDTMPIELSSDKRLVTTFEMSDAQMLGIKVDNLAVRTLDICKNCLDAIGKSIDDIDIYDESIYKYLQNREEYYGLFQISEGLGEQTVKRVRPSNFEEIIVCISIGRPGCMKFIDGYENFKKTGEMALFDEKISDIVSSSGGFILWQEQLMQLSQRMASFSAEEADRVRKIVGKKLYDLMPLYRDKFIEGSVNNGYDRDFAAKVFQTFEDSGFYIFNRSHGAGYGCLTAISVWLKSNYYLEFYLACLRNLRLEPEPMVELRKIVCEFNKVGIKLLPPHLVNSDIDFKIEDNNIRFGLSSIRSISEKTFEKLKSFQNEYPDLFTLLQSARQSGLTIGNVSCMIMAGTLDGYLVESRSKTCLIAQLFGMLTDKEKLYCLQHGSKYNFDLVKMLPTILDWADSNNKKIARATRLGTIRRHSEKYQEIYKLNSNYEDLASWVMEKEMIGFAYSTTLQKIFSRERKDILNLEQFLSLDENEAAVLVVQVEEIHQAKSKKGNKYLKIIVSDENVSNFRLYFCGRSLDSHYLDNKELPKEKDIIGIKVKKNNDNSSAFVEKLSIQSNKVYLKLSDLKDLHKDKQENENQQSLNLQQN